MQPRVGPSLATSFATLHLRADKNIQTNKGEVAAQLTSEGVIKVLLNAQASKLAPLPSTPKEPKLPITPNYIKNPPVAYQVPAPHLHLHLHLHLHHQVDLGEKEQPAVVEKKPRMMEGVEVQAQVQTPRRVAVVPAKHLPPQDLILKVIPMQQSLGISCNAASLASLTLLQVRVEGSTDPDYLEMELPRDALTLEVTNLPPSSPHTLTHLLTAPPPTLLSSPPRQYLTVAACEELGVEAATVERIRKMPNTRLRRDREVAR